MNTATKKLKKKLDVFKMVDKQRFADYKKNENYLLSKGCRIADKPDYPRCGNCIHAAVMQHQEIYFCNDQVVFVSEKDEQRLTDWVSYCLKHSVIISTHKVCDFHTYKNESNEGGVI